MKLSRNVRKGITYASMAGIAAMALACPGPAPDPGGPDLFRVAIGSAPGGSFLGVWGDPAGPVYLAGGFVGVDPATLGTTPAGRLVEYTGTGTFVTLCTTDHALWWVHGVTDGTGTTAVYASGDAGRVIRYQGGHCDTLDLGLTLPQGAPTLWGISDFSPTDVWFVGGSPQPSGPHGVMLRYDGTAFHPVTTLPADAQGDNLYKIAAWQGQMVVVGENGLVLTVDPSGVVTLMSAPVPTADNRLFTVSCSSDACWAVGGAGSGFMMALATGPGGWSVPMFNAQPPGLNGVFMQNDANVFMVGVGGFTMHTNGTVYYIPPSAPTMATLHGVGGNESTVIAVGGELDVANPTQHGVVLIRGDNSPGFTLDGVPYAASGSLRTSLGGSGQ